MPGIMHVLGRLLDGAGEALRTPSGVNPELLRSYAPKGPNGELDFFGNEVSTRHLRGR